MILKMDVVYRGKAECRVMPLSAVTRLDVDKRQVTLRTCSQATLHIHGRSDLSSSMLVEVLHE